MREGPTVRATLRWALVAALAGCVGGDDGVEPCPSGELRVCRAVGDCRCGPYCPLGQRCPASAAMAARVCAEVDGLGDQGVCVDTAWLTGRSDGRLPCGTATCAAEESCVDWGRDGVRCAGPCSRNGECSSGCCTTVGGRDGQATRQVCAPNTNYRCDAGSPAGRGCSPACSEGQSCFLVTGTPRCLARCGAAAECPMSCCVATMHGTGVCSPDAARCRAADPAAGLAPACTSLDACVQVTYASRGEHCADRDSIEVRVRNDCTRPADIEICYERRDGGCVCGMHRNVAPGADATPVFWACGLSGRFRLSGRAAGDAPGCHPSACN